MFIAVDGISNDLPTDVRELASAQERSRSAVDQGTLYGGDALETAIVTTAKGSELDRWDVQSHQYRTEAEVDASILARLFSGKAKASRRGLVQEAKRYLIQTTDSGRKVEFGCAVRLSVAVDGTDLEMALTLPNIAAKAQLSDLRARIALSVDGYTGPLGEMLPAPDNLNVENLTVYTTAFKSIQAQVFGTSGVDHISPTLLGYGPEPGDRESA